MPEYQGLEGGLERLEFLRLLFGVFPTFRESPLQPGFDRWVRLHGVHAVCVGGVGGWQQYCCMCGLAHDLSTGCVTPTLLHALSYPPCPSPLLRVTHSHPPLSPRCRVLQIGDASGIQSPLSFGGFGALTRHLARLAIALTDALSTDALSARDLGLINSYNPGLSSAWMLQVGGGIGGGGVLCGWCGWGCVLQTGSREQGAEGGWSVSPSRCT